MDDGRSIGKSVSRGQFRPTGAHMHSPSYSTSQQFTILVNRSNHLSTVGLKKISKTAILNLGMDVLTLTILTSKSKYKINCKPLIHGRRARIRGMYFGQSTLAGPTCRAHLVFSRWSRILELELDFFGWLKISSTLALAKPRHLQNRP